MKSDRSLAQVEHDQYGHQFRYDALLRQNAAMREALRAYRDAARSGDWGAAIEGGNALLRELGEE